MSSGAPRQNCVEKNSSLPSVKILVPAGTLLPRLDKCNNGGYSVGLTVNDLIEAVPSLAEKANLDYLSSV
ncbi:CBM_HP2_G0030370.mRNA.1.CDS.1 [Saccharomyces cerevisiae]|nr:CBM_HP2_G0030370.mRNA.1.CDS.1 [Saccharomyces cerevisiae]CAI6565496.1 CBM_HP2_G0030370.mRNA.1.CDS.1 [Saccharomyces cerevisiae]